MPLAAIAGIGLAGSIGGAAISSNAAGNAADEQAKAANNAANLQYQASQNALDFQKQQYTQGQANLAPWLQSGNGALTNLNYLMGVTPQGIPGGSSTAFPSATAPTGQSAGMARPTASVPTSSVSGLSLPGGTPAAGTSPTGAPGSAPPPANSAAPGGFGSLLQPYSGSFSAPTEQEFEQNDPGYQARLKLGTDAIQRSAAARGGVVTGGTAQALDQFGQDYASNEYNNAYNRAYNTYSANYNQYNQGQSNEYNRLAGLANVGQTAANTLGTLGQNAASGVTSNLLNTAGQMGQDYQNAGAANASGYVGSASAWNNGLTGLSSNLTQLQQLQNLYGGGNTPTLNTSGGMGMTGGYDYGAPSVNTPGFSAYDPTYLSSLGV